MSLKLGVIGFGEAGTNIIEGLSNAGLAPIYVYDKLIHQDKESGGLRDRAEEIGVELVNSTKQLCQRSTYIFSFVPPSEALQVATETSQYLEQGMTFVDFNSTSPIKKREGSKSITKKGATFIDAAIMASVKAYQHTVPILASGKQVAQFIDDFKDYGMNIQPIKGEVGNAITIKMIRSTFMKGLEALLVETLLAAKAYNVEKPVLESISESIDKKPFKELLNILVISNSIHAHRKAGEMEFVLETLKSQNTISIMSSATKSLLEWSANLKLDDHFRSEPAQDYHEVISQMTSKL